jgi:hypothetical protein
VYSDEVQLNDIARLLFIKIIFTMTHERKFIKSDAEGSTICVSERDVCFILFVYLFIVYLTTLSQKLRLFSVE